LGHPNPTSRAILRTVSPKVLLSHDESELYLGPVPVMPEV
jgi:hypothetical protein